MVEVEDFIDSGLMRGFMGGRDSGCRGAEEVQGALIVLRVDERICMRGGSVGDGLGAVWGLGGGWEEYG